MFGRVLLNLNTKGIRFVLVLLSLGVLLLFFFLLRIVLQSTYQGIDLDNLVS